MSGDWLSEWVEEVSSTGKGGSSKDEYMKVRIDVGALATPWNQTDSVSKRWVSFPADGAEDREAAVNRAKDYLESLGEEPVLWGRGKNVQVPAITITRYLDTHLGVDTSDWSGTPALTYSDYARQMKSGDEYVTHPMWELLYESVVKIEDGVNVAPFAGFDYGKDVWAHVRLVADPSFDRDNPRKSNSEKGVNAKGEEQWFAKRNPILIKVFSTRDELIAYMRETGVNVIGVGDSPHAPKLSDVTDPVQWRETCEIGLPEWNEYLKDLHKTISDHVKDLQSKKFMPKDKFDASIKDLVAKISSDWDGLPVSILEEVVNVVLGLQF